MFFSVVGLKKKILMFCNLLVIKISDKWLYSLSPFLSFRSMCAGSRWHLLKAHFMNFECSLCWVETGYRFIFFLRNQAFWVGWTHYREGTLQGLLVCHLKVSGYTCLLTLKCTFVIGVQMFLLITWVACTCCTIPSTTPSVQVIVVWEGRRGWFLSRKSKDGSLTFPGAKGQECIQA